MNMILGIMTAEEEIWLMTALGAGAFGFAMGAMVTLGVLIFVAKRRTER